MPDRENVIAALHCRAYDDDLPCCQCAYYKQDEKPVARCDYRGIMDDAIALLKEHETVNLETVNPKKVKGFNPPLYVHFSYVCDGCGTDLLKDQPYCAGCGKPVKWE